MDIVDAQVHLGQEGFAETLAQMDALGINAAMLAESWGRDAAGRLQPGHALPGGVWRRTSPLAEQAVILHPDRFTYLAQVNRQDPNLAAYIEMLASTPGAKALRAMPLPDIEAFANGDYRKMFGLAQDAGLPVFIMLSGKTGLLARYAQEFPRLDFIIDHCGVPWGAGDAASLGEVLKLAAYPKVAFKWAHAQGHFGVTQYPYAALIPHLRKTIDAFGAERVMWASDHTTVEGQSWADLLFWLRDSKQITEAEKAAILGGTARRILDWPGA